MALLLHYRKLLRPGGSSYHDSSAAAGDHEHRATAAHGFIVDVDAHNGIGAPLACPVYHLLDGCVLGLNEHLLIGCRPASEKSVIPAIMSLNTLAPMMVSPVTTPRYF